MVTRNQSKTVLALAAVVMAFLLLRATAKLPDQLPDPDAVLPNYKGQGYEIAGFGWFQGHKDGGKQTWTEEYESNLVNLINDVRAEFKVPKLPVVVATVGFSGRDMKGRYLQILEAQKAVGDPVKYPDFAGNVPTVDTQDF